MLKFVDSNAETFDLKRKQPPARACKECRRKKKRCTHAPDSERARSHRPTSALRVSMTTSPATAASAPALMAIDLTQHNEPFASDDSSQLGKVDSAEADTENLSQRLGGRQNASPLSKMGSMCKDGQVIDPRFIGNMNPEGVFLAATSPQNLRGSPSGRSVGLWHAKQSNGTDENQNHNANDLPSGLFAECMPAMQQIFLPVLQRDCLSTLPPPAHLQKFRTIYFQKFHPIFPVLDPAAYEVLPLANAERILLDQGICLLVSVDTSVRPHLLIGDETETLTCKVFGRRVFAAMRIVIEMGLVTDKTILTQALALMSLFAYGRDSSDNSSLTIARAVQYVYSLGLHVPDSEEDANSGHASTLFCCIWLLDRLHVALLGKPVLIHEQDIERPLEQCFDMQTPPFRLLLYVAELIDKVVPIYRPRNDAIEFEGDFPLFEDMIIKCDAVAIDSNHLATAETLYHAIAMLSCRSRAAETNRLPSAAARNRQAFSSESVTAIVGKESYDRLVLLPFVPYAISLCLSLNYREMRRSKVPALRSRARVAFEENCSILNRLGLMFNSAASMAEMGISILKEVDRVYFQALGEARRKSVATIAVNNTNVDSHQALQPDIASADIDTSEPQDFDAFYFTNMPSLDPFEMFDTSFDLTDVDAYLEGNLDLAAPMDWFS